MTQNIADHVRIGARVDLPGGMTVTERVRADHGGFDANSTRIG